MSIENDSIKLHGLGANIIPIRHTKVPGISWEDLQSRRQTKQEIDSYSWSTSTGLAIISGVNGYTCLDIDKAHNDNSLKALVAGLGLPPDYRWQVRSGSGIGYHVWIRVNGEIPLANGKGVIKGASLDGSFDHIELRWKNCYTLVPPSVHESGNTYRWIHGEPDTEPTFVEISRIIDAFSLIASLDTRPEKTKARYEATEYSTIIRGGIPVGARNDTVAKLAGHYRRRGLPMSETVELLLLWNKSLVEPLSENEIHTTADSIYSYPSQEVKFYNGLEMRMMKKPHVQDMVEGIIREHSLVFLAGEEGSGKSITAMNLALSVACGREEFLSYKIKKHGTVLYLNNEIYFEDFLLRFDRMTTHLTSKERVKIDNFVVPQSMPPLDQLWQQLVTTVSEKKPVMVVLDCLYWAHNKQENDSSEMKELMRRLVELRETYGIVVLVVHHTKKGTRYETMHNDNMRGSSVFGGATDTVLMFRRSQKDEGLRLLKPTKLRHGGDDVRTPRLLDLDPNSLWFRDVGEANELEHIASEPCARAKAEDRIDWVAIFDTATILTRKEIHERCEGMKLSERTLDRELKKASNKISDDRELDQIQIGKYALHKPADLTLPVAA